ncbi:condensation domain-containing protein [Variovorax sp. CT11-76]
MHERILQLARDGQASVFMVLQAALAGLLSRLGAGDDIVIGSPVAGRSDHALDELIGCFVNTLVLRTDASGRPSLRELVSRVRATNLAAYANQEFPYDRLVELQRSGAGRARTNQPLFQVMLGFQNSSRLSFSLPGLSITPQPVEIDTAKFDLSFILSEQRGAVLPRSKAWPAAACSCAAISSSLLSASSTAGRACAPSSTCCHGSPSSFG